MAVNTTKYRADIDGLRALAIVPVVLYHYGIPGVTGGFVGVDVFFVISGYLITGIIAAEIRDGSFTLAGFYERRVRRIFPALLVVALVSFAIGTVILAPGPLTELGAELTWASFFSTNIWFFEKDGYFDGTAAMRPLLHSWSLAVEEQFYIVMPLLLRWTLALRRGPDRTVICLILVFAGSLLLSIVDAGRAPAAGFYLLPARAWELLCGGLLAVGRLPKPGPVQAEILSLAGFAAIVAAIFTFTAGTPFPGAAALLPCLGATALIWAGEREARATTSRLLSSRLPVWIGRISYPLYLWHWPLLVLARHGLFREPSLTERLALIALSVVLAEATTRWIEAPVRGRRLISAQTPTLIAGAGVLVLLFTIGQATVISRGIPDRLPAEAIRLAQQDHDLTGQFCGLNPHFDLHTSMPCDIGNWAGSDKADFIVWGDSHAQALIPAFDKMARNHGLHGFVIQHPGCEPLLGVSETGPKGVSCRDFNAAVVTFLKARPVPIVFLVGLWAKIAEARPPLALCAGRGGQNGAIIDVIAGITADDGSHAAFDNGLGRTLAFLNGIRIVPILLQDTPCQFTEIPPALAMAKALHRSLSGIEEKRAAIDLSQAWVDSRLEAAETSGHARFLRTRAVLCGPETCPVESAGEALYRDSSHLSLAGAMRLVPVLEQALKSAERWPARYLVP